MDRDAFSADGRLQLARGAVRDDAAVVDDGDGVRELVGLLQVLGGEQDGGAVRHQVLHGLPGVGPAPRVETGGGLVQEDHGGPRGQGARQVQAAAHTAGETPAGPVGRVGEREPVEQLAGAAPGRPAAHAVQPGDELEVLPRGQPLVDGGVLAGQADAGPYGLRRVADVVPGDRGPAAVRAQQRGQDAHRGGLARAVGAEQAEDAARRGPQVDARQRPAVAEAPGEALGHDRVLPPGGHRARVPQRGQGLPERREDVGAGCAHRAASALRGVRSVQWAST
ncbi:hypothetical protein BC342_26840 [Streptomyces olivaceus]|nr:hypothetical protein BC342_26840 [Streptomyces olivaceus]